MQSDAYENKRNVDVDILKNRDIGLPQNRHKKIMRITTMVQWECIKYCILPVSKTAFYKHVSRIENLSFNGRCVCRYEQRGDHQIHHDLNVVKTEVTYALTGAPYNESNCATVAHVRNEKMFGEVVTTLYDQKNSKKRLYNNIYGS